MNGVNADRLITSAEAAEILGLDRGTVQQMARSGKVPYRRTSRSNKAHFRFRESDIRALADRPDKWRKGRA